MTWWLLRLRRLGRDIRAFAMAPWGRRRLAIEAGWELVRARVQTFRTTKAYISDLGEMGRKPPMAAPEQVKMAQEIGEIVRRAAKIAPFRAVCLQQAIAVRRMLSRRGIPATVFLGLSTDGKTTSSTPGERDAHAWVMTGPKVVSGDNDLDRFAVVASFG